MNATARRVGGGDRPGHPARNPALPNPALVMLLAALTVSCTPVRESIRHVPSPPPPPVKATAEAPPTSPAPPSTHPRADAPRVTRRECSGITFEGVSFDSRSHKLVVVDQPGGPGSSFADAASAGRSRNALAAVNAGFFTPDGAPLGLVVSSGRRAGSWNAASSLGSGIWCDSGNGPRIIRRDSLGSSAASSMQELVQAGPMLVAGGRTVAGLNADKSSIRTLILWDGGSRWWIGRTSFCTLSRAALAIHEQPASWPVLQALNLDGGRSTDLWISSSVSGGPASWHTPFNKPVRNFLLLVPR